MTHALHRSGTGPIVVSGIGQTFSHGDDDHPLVMGIGLVSREECPFAPKFRPCAEQDLFLRVFRNETAAWEVYTTVYSDRSAYEKGNIFKASRQTDAVWWTID